MAGLGTPGIRRIAALTAVAVGAGACRDLARAPAETAETDSAGRPLAASVQDALGTITAADVSHRVGVVAADSMRGRDTPSSGLDATAEWIAAELGRFGLKGGAPEGGFLQRYPLRTEAVDSAGSSITAGTVTLAYGPDVAPLRGGSASVHATAPLVVVTGSAGTVGSLGVDVRGRHVVMTGDRDGSSRSALRLAEAIAHAGALSVWVPSRATDEVWRDGMPRSFQPEVTKAWGPPPPTGGAATPLLTVREPALVRALAAVGVDLAEQRAGGGERAHATIAPGGAVSLTHLVRRDTITAPNVVAVLDGSDPDLSEQYLVFSAHMDHLGIGPANEAGDSIYNGADDDASGTAGVVEIAQAMASLPVAPPRSTVYLLVSGEEEGLWGSEWYAEHPTVPIERLVADLNLDMIGRNWADTIVAIGREHSDLGETLDRVTAAHPDLGITAIDDPWPEERFYYRSDHFNFARRGVPVLFFFNGTHEDYHGVDDEPDRLDAAKAARVARLVFLLGLEVARAPGRPQWNPESYEEIVGR